MLRVAIIGCGKVGYSAMINLSELPEYEVVGLCDTDQDSIDTFLFSFNYKKEPFATSDYKELLKQKDIDAVIIATPTDSHIRIAKDALKHRKDIFLEKPVGVNLKEVDDLIKAAVKTDRIIDISLPYRNSNIFNSVHNLCREHLGGTKFAVFNEHRYNFLRPWFYDEKKSGGAINDKMIHYFNLANELYYPSKPVRVFATGSQHKLKRDFDVKGMTGERYHIEKSNIVDNASITVEYSGNELAVFTLNLYQEFPIEENKISITGLNGNHLIVYNLPYSNASLEMKDKQGQQSLFKVQDRSDMDANGVTHPGSKMQLRNFYNAVKKRRETDNNLLVMRNAHMISEAARLSIERKRSIDVSKLHSEEVNRLALTKGWSSENHYRHPKLIAVKRKNVRVPLRFLFRRYINTIYWRKIRRLLRRLSKEHIPDTSDLIALHMPTRTFFIRVKDQRAKLLKKTSEKPDVSLKISNEGVRGIRQRESLHNLLNKGHIQVEGDLESIKRYRTMFEHMMKGFERVKK